MSVEYLKAKEEALEQLRSTCIQNLRTLQESHPEIEFGFFQDIGEQRKDPRFFSFWGQFRASMAYYKPTYNKYVYKNGEFIKELWQHEEAANPRKPVPGAFEQISLHEIPFKDFSENDLLDAAKIIEAHLQPVTVS